MFETVLAREANPMKRMMLRMATDPESVIAVNQDPNASAEYLILSSIAARHVIENGGTDSLLDHVMMEAGQSGEECRLM